jgi:hypothetical protein
MNKDNLSRKFTILLHEKAVTTNIYKRKPEAVAKAVDNILSCASFDFLIK